MDYFPVSDLAARQSIDSNSVFDEYRRVRTEARKYIGGMYWKRQGDHEYLVKTSPDNRQHRLGPRSQTTEQVYQDFTVNKLQVEKRLKSMSSALTDAQRMNKASKAGRVPRVVVELLQALEDAGLSKHFVIVGTHALYAYETAAGVRIAPGALATEDVDLLWDARHRVKFLTDMKRSDASILRILKSIDPSFRRKDMHNEAAINAKGFQVEFLRRMAIEGDPHPFRFSDDPDDLWPVQARRASTLTDAPKFEHMVISTTGHMALMRTVSPDTFVEFKRWMSGLQDRPAVKKQRDLKQAAIVQTLLDNHLLIPMPPVAAKQSASSKPRP